MGANLHTAIGGQDIFCLRPGFFFWRDRADYLYLDKAKVKAGALNASAFHTLRFLDGKTPVTEVAARVVEALNVEPALHRRVHADIHVFLADCLEQKVILRGHIRSYLDQFWGESENSDGYGLKQPDLLYWETTKVCNLKCSFCYNDCAPVRPGKELSAAEGEDLIGRFAGEGLRSILFTGGECTAVFHKLERWLRACKAHGLSTQMITNGTGITPERARTLKDAGLGYCRVSVHSTRAALHDALVGVPGTWPRAIGALHALRAAGLPHGWQMTVGTQNLCELRDAVEKAIEFECEGFVVGPLRAIGRGKNMQPYLLTPAQEIQLSRFIDETSTVYGDKIRVGWGANFEREKSWRQYVTEPIRPAASGSEDFKRWFMHYAKNSVCSVGARTVAMNAQGEYILCPSLSELALGSAFETPLRQVWRHETVALFRKTALDDFDNCGKCNLRYGCMGGCRSIAYHSSHSLTGCDQSYRDAMEWLSTHGIEEVPSFYTSDEIEKHQKSFKSGEFKVGVQVEETGPWAASFSPSLYAE